MVLKHWCIIETSSGPPRNSSAIFGNFREMFRNVHLEFENLWNVVENLLKIIENTVISMFIIWKRALHVTCSWENVRERFLLALLKVYVFLKVPMKAKIEVLKNRRIWKAFKSDEEWCIPFCHISSSSRDIQDFCNMQIRYWWHHKVWQCGSQTQNREYLCK